MAQLKLDLEKFVRAFVFEAFKLVREGGEVSIHPNGRFYTAIHEQVSEQLKLPLELIVRLDKPFHWAFFNTQNSPFEYIMESKEKGHSLVRFKDSTTVSEEELSREIIDKYSEYFTARIDKYVEEVSILHQPT